MRISVASDHRGFQIKEQIVDMLRDKGYEVDDAGTSGPDSVDYPDFAAIVAEKISNKTVDRGILICGTGIGMAIAANKFPGVRAAPCSDEVTAEISRRHNDLNVLCLSADLISPRTVERMIETWITTEFEGGRHLRRLQKISDLECCEQPEDE